MAPQSHYDEYPHHEEKVSQEGLYKLLTTVLTTVCAILLSLLGWMATETYEQISLLRGRVERLELQQAVNKSVQADFTRALEKIEKKLDLILDLRIYGAPTKEKKLEWSQ